METEQSGKSGRGKRRRRELRITRDLVLFTSGLLGAYHEIVLLDAERPMVLALVAGMLGLPAFLNKDEK